MILVNGCSHTEGYDLGNPELAWPAQLSKITNQPVVNLALGGASNQRIARTTREYLVEHRPDRVIIGWITYNRNELTHSQGAYVRASAEACLSECEHQFSDLPEIHKYWAVKFLNLWVNYRNWIYDVLFFQQYFTELKIPFLFFTAYGNNYLKDFVDSTDTGLELADLSYQWRDRAQFAPERTIHREWQELHKLAKQVNLDHWVMHNQHTMFDYLIEQGYERDATNHFLAPGHQQWAEIIAKEIQ